MSGNHVTVPTGAALRVKALEALLEEKGLIERQMHATDRRITLLVASPPVRKFLDTRMPELALHPLLEALAHASATERKAITQGLNTLAQLLSRTGAQAKDEVFDELND